MAAQYGKLYRPSEKDSSYQPALDKTETLENFQRIKLVISQQEQKRAAIDTSGMSESQKVLA